VCVPHGYTRPRPFVPACAESEFQLKLDRTVPGITPKITFTIQSPQEVTKKTEALKPTSAGSPVSVPLCGISECLPIAILREQGVNGEVEMTD
jgi:phosphoribosylformylglycinamidine synthase